jgi:hypothetical protein
MKAPAPTSMARRTVRLPAERDFASALALMVRVRRVARPAGNKLTTEFRVLSLPRGRFVQGMHTGPAQNTEIATEIKRSFLRSASGPDPYNRYEHKWKTRQGAFAPASELARVPFEPRKPAANTFIDSSFDPYGVGRPDWLHTPSRSLAMPHSRASTPTPTLARSASFSLSKAQLQRMADRSGTPLRYYLR